MSATRRNFRCRNGGSAISRHWARTGAFSPIPALVACLATVMAVIFGFVVAWILTRTRVPGGSRLERLMELPYYMTPLVGALAWAILASPRTGALNQLWHGDRRQRRPLRHLFAVRHRLGHGAVRGHRRLCHDLGGDEVDGPVARGNLARARRRQIAHRAEGDPAPGHAGRAGGDDLCLCRDAGLLRRRLCTGDPGPLLRDHHRDLAGDDLLPAGLRPRRGNGDFAVRGDAGDLDDLPADRAPRQLCDDHRQGVPPARDGCRARRLGVAGGVLGLHPGRGRIAAGGVAADLVPALCHGHHRPDAVHPRQLRECRQRFAAVRSALVNSLVLGFGVASIRRCW